jgi:CMP-N-acetylneuraminic acid synthetase
MRGQLVAIVPARGGSKRIPRKNLALLLGRPMLAYTLQAARDSGVVDRLLVSTDSDEIAELACSLGVDVVRRPAELAGDDVSTEAVLLHVLEHEDRQGRAAEHVLTLPPTSPLRSAQSIRSFVEAYDRLPGDFDALISLTEDRGDYWIREPDGSLRRLSADAPRRQQDRVPLLEENSALYLTRVTALRATRSILGRRAAGFILDRVEAWDVNEPLDLEIAEILLARRLANAGSGRTRPA